MVREAPEAAGKLRINPRKDGYANVEAIEAADPHTGGEAARALGIQHLRIAFRHVMPTPSARSSFPGIAVSLAVFGSNPWATRCATRWIRGCAGREPRARAPRMRRAGRAVGNCRH
jgi:hypothetical protein